MHLILFLIAIVLAFAGVVLLLYSVPVIDVAAAALFTSGMMAMVGGFLLAGLAAAGRTLSRLVRLLKFNRGPGRRSPRWDARILHRVRCAPCRRRRLRL